MPLPIEVPVAELPESVTAPVTPAPLAVTPLDTAPVLPDPEDEPLLPATPDALPLSIPAGTVPRRLPHAAARARVTKAKSDPATRA